MEGLKVIYDLKVIAEILRIPILVHFFQTFDPMASKELAYTISKIHLKDYAASDYRSAYHQLCDWFYGWNVTDVLEMTNAEKGLLTEQFTMKRVPRKINLEEKLEQSECLRIRSNYETLFLTARRSLNKLFLETEEWVLKIGTNITDEMEEKVGRGAGEVGEDVESKRDIWAEGKAKEEPPSSAEKQGEQDVEGMAREGEEVSELLQSSYEGLKATQADGETAKDNANTKDTNSSPPTSLYKPPSATLNTSPGFSNVSIPQIPALGTFKLKADRSEEKEVLQRDIDFIYQQLDKALDFELICATSALIVLALSEALDEFVMYDKQCLLVHELSSEIISNTVITMWDLLQRELPPNSVTMNNIRDMKVLKDLVTKVIKMRIDKSKLTRAARLPVKLSVLHTILTSMDIFLFPKHVEAHKEGLKGCQYSFFDTNIWLTCGYDGAIRIFNLQTQEKLAQFIGHKSVVTDVGFGRNDAFLVSSSFDRTLKMWNAYNGACEKTFTGHIDSITSSDISPDGRHILSGSMDNTVRLWDVSTGQCLTVIKKHNRWIKIVRFTPDGKYFLSAGLDLRIYVWDTKMALRSKTLTHLRCIEIHNDYILSMEMSRDGHLLTSSRDQTIKLSNYNNGVEIYGISLAPSWACTVAFSDDGDMFAAGSFDNNIMLFSTSKGERIRQLRVFNLGIQVVRFAKNYEYVVCGTREGLLQLVPI